MKCNLITSFMEFMIIVITNTFQGMSSYTNDFNYT